MAYVIVFIIALIVAMCAAPKAPTPTPAALTDLDLPTAEIGRSIPVVFGSVLLKSPNVVWYGDLGYVAVKSGGK